jgi:hypothetical protein
MHTPTAKLSKTLLNDAIIISRCDGSIEKTATTLTYIKPDIFLGPYYLGSAFNGRKPPL